MARTIQKYNWSGKSGEIYPYEVYELDTSWNDVPAGYIFAREISANQWVAAYIGEAESLKRRIPNHEEWPCARRNGVTHIHARINRDRAARLTEETDLRAAHNPPCNLQ